MHTLAIFPELLTFGLFAPLLLRGAVGILRLFVGIEKLSKGNKWFSILDIVSSIAMLIGLYTQVAVIVAIICVAFDFYSHKKRGISHDQYALTVLSLAILISLLFTGPGFMAFDWPL